ncbi:STAS domain-containing protein [Streptomyces sp. NPDC048636]|uniref:STAS domain-containing protein n=1 Tax=Streptomyces sp. NPDC048636 TaxID=3155762 RepID=UPI003429CD02
MTTLEGPAGVARSERAGDIWLISLFGDFDINTTESVSHAIAEARRHHGRAVVFDLHEVTFCDSSLLNHLLHTARSDRVVLVSAPGEVLRLLAVTGTEGVLPHYPDLATARAAIGGGEGPGNSR